MTLTNLVPIMTSNTAPSGICSASQNNADAWKGFQAGGELWMGYNYSWLQYQFSTPQDVTGYAITAGYNDGIHNPDSWLFQGSVNGTNWVTLDTQTNQSGLLIGNRTVYNINNVTQYSYFRLYNLVSGDPYHLVGRDPLNGGSYIRSVEILTGNNRRLNPVMTSNTAPSGIASASSEHLWSWTGAAWRAFSGSNLDFWQSLADSNLKWLSYQFPTLKVITGYALEGDYNPASGQNPDSWLFQGSNDGISWTTLDSKTGQGSILNAGFRQEYSISGVNEYKYARLYNMLGTSNQLMIRVFDIIGTNYVPPTIINRVVNWWSI